MEINPKLLKSIEDYCKFNNILDIEKEINNILQTGFNVIRFGTSPFSSPPIIENIKQEDPPTIPQDKLEIVEAKEEKPKRVYKRKPKVDTVEVISKPIEDILIKEPQMIEEKPKKRVRVIKVKKKEENE